MAEKAAPYRSELEALRARRDDLEGRLEAERAEVKALRQALARRDGQAAPGGPEGASAAKAAGEAAAAPARAEAPAKALEPRTIVPRAAGAEGFLLILAFLLGASALIFTPWPRAKAFGIVSMMGIPIVLWLWGRENAADRYLKIDLWGIEFRGYDCKVRRIVWPDVESTRVVFIRGRHTEYSALHLRVEGGWVELDSDYLSDGQELSDLVEGYRRASSGAPAPNAPAQGAPVLR
jgi:hypothetical protein